MTTKNSKLEILGFLQNIKLSEKKVSGTRSILTDHLNSKGLIKKNIDTEIYGFKKKINLLKNISFNKIKWSYKVAFDVGIKEMRSRLAEKYVDQIEDTYNTSLQIGSAFKLHHIKQLKNIPSFSYHDNNIMALIKSSPPLPGLGNYIKKAKEFEKEVYDHLTGIFTMTDYVRDSFVNDFNIPKNKVHCIGFGANIPYSDFDKKYDGNTILFIAKDSFVEKGGKILLDAFEKVKKARKNVKLKIVGQKLNIDCDGVEVIGFLDKRTEYGREKIEKLYKQASLFVMPSYVEATGNVFLEAMSNKLPCIGADRKPTREIIVDNNSGDVVEPGNASKLSEKIIELLDNRDELTKMGENGYKTIKEKYNWDIVCSKAINIMRTYI